MIQINLYATKQTFENWWGTPNSGGRKLYIEKRMTMFEWMGYVHHNAIVTIIWVSFNMLQMRANICKWEWFWKVHIV